MTTHLELRRRGPTAKQRRANIPTTTVAEYLQQARGNRIGAALKGLAALLDAQLDPCAELVRDLYNDLREREAEWASVDFSTCKYHTRRDAVAFDRRAVFYILSSLYNRDWLAPDLYEFADDR